MLTSKLHMLTAWLKKTSKLLPLLVQMAKPTKDLIAACLAKKYKVGVKTQANFNNEIGLPKTLLTIKPDTEVVVVEMGMRGFGQIRALKALAEPDAVVITNVGETHMELLGSMEKHCQGKSEILENMNEQQFAVLNNASIFMSARWLRLLRNLLMAL